MEEFEEFGPFFRNLSRLRHFRSYFSWPVLLNVPTVFLAIPWL